MSWTKRQFVIQAYRAIGLADYVYDLTAEELQDALYSLDALMAEWNGIGIRLSYPLPSAPDLADLDENTSVPDRANSAIYNNLAMRIAPGLGKNILPELRQAAYSGFLALVKNAAEPYSMQLPGDFPLGAGNKLLPDDQFTDQPAEPYQPWDEPYAD